jgi:pyruvate dehydrogenase E1 component
LFARDKKGILMQRLGEIVDGEYQTMKSKNGAYVRKTVFNTPELEALVADWSDDDIWALNRGGHDPHKVYAAFKEAQEATDQPTLILAKTVKGYGMGASGEAQNTVHQQKKMAIEDIRIFRDRFDIPVSDEDLEKTPYVRFPEGSKELEYMRARRMELGGYLPQRRRKADVSLQIPELSSFEPLLRATAEGREISTTMSFVRMLNILLKDKNISRNIVPIVPDESRTFGMEGLFRQLGIWSQEGQKYTPQDHDQLMFYKEDKSGQVLQEGINEAGAMCDWIAAATAYSTHNVPMIPFYIFYSMFGFQRIGDLCWAAGDMRARGFLIGGTAGRTTLNGEGLQHEDGHSHLWSGAIPNCISYDPTFAYEVAVIVQDGLRRMYQEQEDVYYYLTVMNENYAHPALPVGQEANIIKGMYPFRISANAQVRLLGSGTIFNEVIAAAQLLKNDWNIDSDLYSCPSFTELARNGSAAERTNMLNPTAPRTVSHVEHMLGGSTAPVIVATDYVRAVPEQIRAFVPARYTVLGTDGFGRSDTREKLRHFFEVNRYWVVVASLKALADQGTITHGLVAHAIAKYDLDVNKPNPMTV